MDKNNGGAKPKTGNGANNNNSNNRQAGGTSTSQVTGAQARNRSPRRENGYASRSNGGVGARGLRSNNRGNGLSNNSNSSTVTTSNTSLASSSGSDTPTNRRASVPNSIARNRYSYSNQNRAGSNNIPQRYNDYSPLRGQGRSTTRQSTGTGTSSYTRPVLRHRTVGVRGHPVSGNMPPLEGPDGDLDPFHSLSAPASSVELSVDDPDSESCSPTSSSPGESSAFPPPRSASLDHLSAHQERPMSTSRDALLARELLQSEMDMMLQQDEELARQMHEEINTPRPGGGLALQRGMPFRQHFPTGQNRHERRPQGPGRDRGFLHNLRLLRDPDGFIRMGFEARRRRESDPHNAPGAEGRRASEPGSDTGSESQSEPVSLDDDSGSSVFERRIMGGDLDPPDDFLNMMNDPSLMLLMLLLRAPDPLAHNEAGVDLEDYEGLWELAERIGDVRRRGISEDQISQLPTHKFKSQCEKLEAAASAGAGSSQCQICLVDFENGDCLRCIPCKHDFHKDCIDEWLKRNATCPICRQDIKPGDR